MISTVAPGLRCRTSSAANPASAIKPDYGHFDVSVTFTGVSGQKGQIKVFGVSPRDGTTPTSYYFIQIRFA